MLYRMRGCPWRDLAKAFGSWSKVCKRFNVGSASGKWLKVFQALVAVIPKKRNSVEAKLRAAAVNHRAVVAGEPRVKACFQDPKLNYAA
jgi:transposase